MDETTETTKRKIHPESLQRMRDTGGEWFAYENKELGHPGLGHLTFMKCGPDCTFGEPPKVHPDTPQAIMWRYHLIGKVDLEIEKVVEL